MGVFFLVYLVFISLVPVITIILIKMFSVDKQNELL